MNNFNFSRFIELLNYRAHNWIDMNYSEWLFKLECFIGMKNFHSIKISKYFRKRFPHKMYKWKILRMKNCQWKFMIFDYTCILISYKCSSNSWNHFNFYIFSKKKKNEKISLFYFGLRSIQYWWIEISDLKH